MNKDILKTFTKYNPSHAETVLELQKVLDDHESKGIDVSKIYEVLEIIINSKIKVITSKENDVNLIANITDNNIYRTEQSTTSSPVKDNYYSKLEELRDKKSDIVYELQMITGKNINEYEDKVEAVEIALKKGTYNQAASVICKVINHDILCNKIDDYKFMFNL